MKYPSLRPLLFVPALALCVPAVAQEHTRPAKGELMWVGAPPADVTFDVVVTTDSTKATKVLSAVVMDFEGDKYPFADVRWDGTRMTFSITPGDRPVSCVLERQEGDRFTGQCPGDVPVSDALIRITIDSLPLPAVESTGEGGASLQRGGARIH